ncbi:MAG TPA: efflux RND transporter permease subunit [Opitutaceae bacterium]|jgi:multidrug efflux pump
MSTFTDIFIKRPVLALVVSFLIFIAGIQAYRTLNVREYPKSENSTVTVTTVYVGASAELVKGFITAPLERSIAAADGIDYLSSSSSEGVSVISARLKINYDPIKALAEISAKVDQVRSNLPAEAQVPAIDVQPADSQIASAYLSFTSQTLKPNEITDYLVRVVQPRLSALAGVQRADILGGRTFAMRVWMRPDRMAAFNVSPSQISAALASNNHLSALGTTKGSLVQVALTANTDLRSVEDFKNLVIRQQNNAVVRLKDVADVELGAEDYDTDVRFSGETAVFMAVYVLPTANALDVIASVKDEMESIQKDLPGGMEARVAYDATAYIRDAIHEVFHTLLDTLLIVVVVIFLFLGSWRSALIPFVAIPLSLIGALFVMQVFGFSLNLLTLLAIVLSVGLVVDDAIVVVENVERHIANGLTPMNAALVGARELVGPIIAMTITLAAVYAPIGLQGGLTGTLFREFAFTLAGAVIISGIVALTLSPMMSANLLRRGDEEKGFAGVVTHTFERIRRGYARALDFSLANRGVVYVVWVVIGFLGVAMIANQLTPKELAPAEDQGFLFGFGTTAANSTLDQNLPYASAIEKTFFSDPDTAFVFQITSPGSGQSPTIAGLVAKPWGERRRTIKAMMASLQPKVSQIPGIQLQLINPPVLPGGGTFPIEVVLTSTSDPQQMLGFARQLQAAAMATGRFYFTTIDLKYDEPQAEVVLDRDKVAAMGLNLQQIGDDLSAAIGGNYINWFNISGRSYKVISQIKREDRLNPSQLEKLYVTGPAGSLIPLSTVATIKYSTIPRALNRFQQLNSVTISGQAGMSLDDALKTFEDEGAKILPKGYNLDYTGESRQLRKEGGSSKFWTTMLLAVVLIFLVLSAQFNSFRDPFVILAGSVPLAVFGSAIFMFLKFPNPQMHYFTDGWTTSFNIYSQVGLVTLVGLIAKNGILIVEFANKQQLAGRSKLDAVHDAALTRLRPILMTSVATVAGHFPLTLVTGAGAAARNSIGLTLVGGMSIGTFFTLVVLPSIYMLVAKDHSKERAATEEPPSGGAAQKAVHA